MVACCSFQNCGLYCQKTKCCKNKDGGPMRSRAFGILDNKIWFNEEEESHCVKNKEIFQNVHCIFLVKGTMVVPLCTWHLEEIFRVGVSFHHVSFRNWIQIIWPGLKCPYGWAVVAALLQGFKDEAKWAGEGARHTSATWASWGAVGVRKSGVTMIYLLRQCVL